MDNRNLEKALEIFSCLVKGEEISAGKKETASLYEEYIDNPEVYDIVMTMCRKMNLSLYEYNDTLYISPGKGNRVFGYSNEELKKEIGIRLNRELYLCYFVMFGVITRFYSDTSSETFTEYVRSEDIIAAVDSMLASTLKEINLMSLDEVEENSFQAISGLWEELPLVVNEDAVSVKASKGSKAGYVKLVFNFMEKQELLLQNDVRYYPTGRLKALIENYFDENKGELYNLVKGAVKDAAYQQNQGE